MKLPSKNWLEWTVFAAGLTLLVAVVGYLVVQVVRHRDEPAALTIALGEPWSPAGTDAAQLVVPITVGNHGGQTAAEVDVEVLLVRDGKALERRELTFPFVPRRSSRSGSLTFQRHPRREELVAHVLGYLEP